MKLANGIVLDDGRRLDEVINELEKLKGVDDKSIDLADFVKKSELSTLEDKINSIIIPDISDLAKESEIVTLKNILNQLIADLQAGKYNINVTSTASSTTV